MHLCRFYFNFSLLQFEIAKMLVFSKNNFLIKYPSFDEEEKNTVVELKNLTIIYILSSGPPPFSRFYFRVLCLTFITF
jgi:hypothetical protein